MEAPDGGWGWVVVCGTFLIHLIMDGMLYSFGVFYVEFLDYFQSDKGVTSLIGSLLNGMLCFTGPLASILIHRFGTRTVAISGAIITSLGFLLSAFAPNIYWLCLTFGVIPGIGDSFMWVACVVTVGHYFKDKRAFAMGLAVCGSGIGTFIFAPLTEYLVEKYTWKGAVLIEAGIMLNCVVGGMLFRPLPLSEKLINKEEDRREENSGNLMNDKKCVDNTVTTNGLVKSDGFLYEKNSKLLQPNYHSLPKLESGCHSYNINSNGGDIVLDVAQSSLLPENYKGQSKHNFQTISNKVKTGCSYLSEKIGLYMCLDATFLLFVISGCFYTVGSAIPYIYLVDRARDSGMSKPNAAILLSAAGISNTVARLFFGWLAARSFANSSYIYGTAIIICGLGTGLSPFSDSNEYLLCYSALFGACAGIGVCLNSIVLVDFVGIEKLTSGFGVVLLFKGIATLVGVPAAGALYDMTGNYALTFYLAGGILCLSGILVFVGYITKQRRLTSRDEVAEKWSDQNED